MFGITEKRAQLVCHARPTRPTHTYARTNSFTNAGRTRRWGSSRCCRRAGTRHSAAPPLRRSLPTCLRSRASSPSLVRHQSTHAHTHSRTRARARTHTHTHAHPLTHSPTHSLALSLSQATSAPWPNCCRRQRRPKSCSRPTRHTFAKVFLCVACPHRKHLLD